MLKLRKEHLEAFEAQTVSLFAARVVTHLKSVWPVECGELGEAAVTDLALSTIKRGAKLGLSKEHDMVRFVDLAFVLATDFDTNPLAGWARTILADRTLAPDAKMDRLYQRMEEEFTLIEKRKGGKP